MRRWAARIHMSSLDSMIHDVYAEMVTIVCQLALQTEKKDIPRVRRPRAWVEFVFQHATVHGWDSFTTVQITMDKKTREKRMEEVVMPASVLYEGNYIYEGSVTEKTPKGKKMMLKDAMPLSKSYWAVKTEQGTQQALYQEFLASYHESEVINREEE
jgi:hypothetical protein